MNVPKEYAILPSPEDPATDGMLNLIYPYMVVRVLSKYRGKVTEHKYISKHTNKKSAEKKLRKLKGKANGSAISASNARGNTNTSKTRAGRANKVRH